MLHEPIEWTLIERIRTDPAMRLRFIPTNYQLAVLLTKATFTSQKWQKLCQLSNLIPRLAPRREKQLPTIPKTLAVEPSKADSSNAQRGSASSNKATNGSVAILGASLVALASLPFVRKALRMQPKPGKDPGLRCPVCGGHHDPDECPQTWCSKEYEIRLRTLDGI